MSNVLAVFHFPTLPLCKPTSNQRLIIRVVLLILLSFSPTFAQNASQPDVIRVRTDLVTVPVIVTDSHGRRVFGLTERDFSLRSDHGPLTLEFFSIGTERVAVAFLLDASGSARDYLLPERDAALALFSRFGSGSQIAVLRFDNTAEIRTDFTSDRNRARLAFDFPAVVNTRTAIFDSAMTILRMFSERKSDPTERRIIILTSDGLDTASRTKPRDVIQSAQRAGISFYVIHFPIFSPREGKLAPRPPVSGFRELAESTGGHYFIIGNVASALTPARSYDLSPIFKAIEEDLEGQYLLGFYPEEWLRDGATHQVDVTLTSGIQRYRVKTLRKEFRVNRDE